MNLGLLKTRDNVKVHMCNDISRAAERYAGQTPHLVSTHLDPSHFALMTAQTALSMAPPHRHLGQRGEQQAGGGLIGGAHTRCRPREAHARWTGLDWLDVRTRESARADVGRIRRDTRVWSEVSSHYARAGPQTLSMFCLPILTVEIYRQG